MNNARRKEIAAIVDKLDALHDLVSEIQESIDTLRDDEQEAFDNMPESLQQSSRGCASEEAVSSLSDASSMLEDLDIETLRGYLESASE